MAGTIIQRIIGGLQSEAIQLATSQFARSVTLPAAWSKIRVGIRWHCTDGGVSITGTTTVPRFFLGFGHGTTNLVGDALTDHFVGLVSTSGGWIRNATNYALGATSFSGCKRVGSTLTLSGDLVASTTSGPGNGAASAAADRTLLFCDVVKGSPNYTFYCFVSSVNAPADVSEAQFLAQMILDPPNQANHQYTAAPQTVAVNEAVDGLLNSVHCSWDRDESIIEVCDLAVAYLA